MRGHPILSKAHGSADLRLHVPLRFNATATEESAEDVGMSIVGSQPAIVFADEGAGQGSVALARLSGRAELHLSGRLLLSDGADARWQCGDSTVTWSSPTAANFAGKLEFGLPEGATGSVLLRLGGEDGEAHVTLGVDAGGAALTVGGAQRLLVDGVDVRETWQACEASKPSSPPAASCESTQSCTSPAECTGCCTVLFKGAAGAKCTAVPIWDFSSWTHPGPPFVTRAGYNLCGAVKHDWRSKGSHGSMSDDPEGGSSLRGGATKVGEYTDPTCRR